MTPTAEKQNISINMENLKPEDLPRLMGGDISMLSPMDRLAVKCAVLASEILHLKEKLGGLFMTPKWRRASRGEEILTDVARLMKIHNDTAAEHNGMIPKDSNRQSIPALKIDLQRLAKLYS